MAAATILQIADALVSELNDPGRTWAGSVEAVRHYMPLFADGPNAVGLDAFKTLQVRVIPRARPDNTLEARGKVGIKAYNRRQVHRIDVVLQQRPPAPTSGDIDLTAFDALELLTENIEAFLLNDQHNLSTFAGGAWARMVSGVLDPYPDQAYLENFGIFVAVIQGRFEAYL